MCLKFELVLSSDHPRGPHDHGAEHRFAVHNQARRDRLLGLEVVDRARDDGTRDHADIADIALAGELLVTKLQVMADAMAGFVQGGADPLRNQKVANFNFAGLAGAFDTARAANTSLTSWALTNALTSFQLAGSDTAALGGDLAYQYGKNGTLAGIGVTPALSTLSDANLGTNAQTLAPLAGLQTGSVRLS